MSPEKVLTFIFYAFPRLYARGIVHKKMLSVSAPGYSGGIKFRRSGEEKFDSYPLPGEKSDNQLTLSINQLTAEQSIKLD